MLNIKTSLSHRLRIDFVATPSGALIGRTLSPGKKQLGAISGDWERDLASDLDTFRDWGAMAAVTLR